MSSKGNKQSLLFYLNSLAAPRGERLLPDDELLKRFVDSRDESSFRTLMGRYGPLVLRVCGRVLGKPNDIDDAFQATFVVFASRAASIRQCKSLASWFHGVALRISRNALRASSRRRTHERNVAERVVPDALAELTVREARTVIEEELELLPEKLRIPVIECNLLGRKRELVARQLGYSLPTLFRRLERGQALLQKRLSARGVVIPAALFAVLLASSAAEAALPAALVKATVQAVMLFASGQSAALGGLAAQQLAGELVRGFKTTKLVIWSTLLVAVSLATGGTLAYYLTNSDPPPFKGSLAQPRTTARKESLAPSRSEPIDSEPKTARISGRILDGDGKAVAFARVAVLARRPPGPGEFNVRDEILSQGQADEAGSFGLTTRLPSQGWSMADRLLQLWAAAPGYAPTTQVLPDQPEPLAVKLCLLRPEPIHGRLVGEDGLPAASVRVSVYQIGGIRLEPIQGAYTPQEPLLWPQPVTTDADGLFTLDSLNLNQGVRVRITDDRYALEKVVLSPSEWGKGRVTTLELGPARVLEGRILAEETGDPLSGARLSVTCRSGTPMDAWADDEGRYRMRLLPGETYSITVFAQPGKPYLPVSRQVVWPEGTGHHELDLSLPRGILLKGTVIDADTGEAVPSAHVQFRPWPNAKAAVAPGLLAQPSGPVICGKDGAFCLAAPNVAGHLVVHEPSGDYVTEEVSFHRGTRKIYANRIMALDPVAGLGVREVRVALRRGMRITGRVVGPDGEPVPEGAWLCQRRTSPRKPDEGQPQPFSGGRFEVRGCVPGRLYRVLFLDARHQIGACVELAADRDGQPAEVKLQYCGEAVVPFVDLVGRPAAGHSPFLGVMVPPDGAKDEREKGEAERPAEMRVMYEFDPLHYRDGPRSGADGRVTLPALIPGVRYRVIHSLDASGRWQEFEVKAGEKLVLPDVVLRQKQN